MDASLIAFLFIVLVFIVRGYKSGIIIMISRLISLPVAYLLSWLLFKPVGHAIQSTGFMEGLLSYVVAAMAVFLVSYLVISGIFSLLQKIILRSDIKNSQLSQFGGALFGAILGLAAGVLAVWFSTTIQTVVKAHIGKTHTPSEFEQSISNLTKSTIRKIAMDNEKAELTLLPAVVLADPSQNIIRLKRISEKGLMQKLLSDQDARTHLNALSPGTLVNNENFKNLIADDDFRRLTEEMNFSTSERELEKQIAMQLATTWAKVRTVQDSPEFQSMINDPELKSLLESKNLLKLSTSNKVERLMNYLATVQAPEIHFKRQPISNTEESKDKPKAKETKIYRWVDENGKVHYSDKKPEAVDNESN